MVYPIFRPTHSYETQLLDRKRDSKRTTMSSTLPGSQVRIPYTHRWMVIIAHAYLKKKICSDLRSDPNISTLSFSSLISRQFPNQTIWRIVLTISNKNYVIFSSLSKGRIRWFPSQAPNHSALGQKLPRIAGLPHTFESWWFLNHHYRYIYSLRM